VRAPRDFQGLWRASLRTADGWQTVREPSGSYATASMLEWGSITKGLVGTTAWLTLEVDRPVVHYLPGVPDTEMTVADLVHHTSGLSRLPATTRD
jgi:CubicO group peptidase (beta-lactamase class C family)